MIWQDGAYNLLLFAVSCGVLTIAWGRKTSRGAIAAAATITASAFLLADILAGVYRFMAMRLACWGLFLHVPVAMAFLAKRAHSQKHFRARNASVLIALGAIGLAVDAFLIEPYWLQITHHQIRSQKIVTSTRIVVIADFQAEKVGSYEERVLREAAKLKPDLVLFAGDYLQTFESEWITAQDKERWDVQRKKFEEAFRKADLRASRGIYAVSGNVDPPWWPELFSNLPVTVMNSTQTAMLGDISLTGLGIWDSAFIHHEVPTQPGYHIILGHLPNYAMGKNDADLLVAGHIHGGQVQIPGFGPIITNARVPRAWAAGMTALPNGRKLFVSRGIGMERVYAPRLRFWCRPELAVIDLRPAAENQEP